MKALVITSCLGIAAMLADVLGYKKILWALIVLTIGAVIGISISEWNQPQTYYGMMSFDNYAIAFTCLLLVITLVWFFLSKELYDSDEFNAADHYALIIFSLVGGICLTSFSNMSMLFMGIEIMSIPLYILAGSKKHELASNEASLKYFLMGAFATGILLFGIALIYGATGSFDLNEIASYVQTNSGNIPMLLYTGILLLMIGLGFKVSAIPFHFWTPDVYEGAPTFITGFMATFVKTAAFAAFFRLFATCFASVLADWSFTLTIIIAITILMGNIIASVQDSVKRMLAYSGISQAGYLLLTILVLNDQTKTALLLYVASYSLSTLAAFAVLYYVSKVKGSESFDAFNGLGKSNPLLALVMTVSMLSLAGIPPTVGFFAKFYLFEAVLQADINNMWIVGIAVIGSLISVYYYFRLIISMYSGVNTPINISSGLLFRTVILILAVIIILLGLFPGSILSIDQL